MQPNHSYAHALGKYCNYTFGQKNLIWADCSIKEIMMLNEMLRDRTSTIFAVLSAFDQLDPVLNEFLFGRWRGFVIATDHSMDNLLTAVGWYGKVFQGVDEAHPLIVNSQTDDTLFSIDPAPLPLLGSATLSPAEMLSRFATFSPSALRTHAPRGRLRMVE